MEITIASLQSQIIDTLQEFMELTLGTKSGTLPKPKRRAVSSHQTGHKEALDVVDRYTATVDGCCPAGTTLGLFS